MAVPELAKNGRRRNYCTCTTGRLEVTKRPRAEQNASNDGICHLLHGGHCVTGKMAVRSRERNMAAIRRIQKADRALLLPCCDVVPAGQRGWRMDEPLLRSRFWGEKDSRVASALSIFASARERIYAATRFNFESAQERANVLLMNNKNFIKDCLYIKTSTKFAVRCVEGRNWWRDTCFIRFSSSPPCAPSFLMEKLLQFALLGIQLKINRN